MLRSPLSVSRASIDRMVGFVPMDTEKPVAFSLGVGIGFDVFPRVARSGSAASSGELLAAKLGPSLACQK